MGLARVAPNVEMLGTAPSLRVSTNISGTCGGTAVTQARVGAQQHCSQRGPEGDEVPAFPACNVAAPSPALLGLPHGKEGTTQAQGADKPVDAGAWMHSLLSTLSSSLTDFPSQLCFAPGHHPPRDTRSANKSPSVLCARRSINRCGPPAPLWVGISMLVTVPYIAHWLIIVAGPSIAPGSR